MELPILRIGTTMDPSIAGGLAARQFIDDGRYYDDGYVSFWYTRTGIIVKWSIFLALLILFFGYLFIGHMHARKRIARGQPPLAYHRWLVPRSQLARVDPRYAYPAPVYSNYPPQQQQPNEYGMYAMPPPVYDPSRPPMYYGPPAGAPPPPAEGNTKVDPDQSRAGYQRPTVSEEQEQQYEAPGGPPPQRTQGATGGNPFRD